MIRAFVLVLFLVTACGQAIETGGGATCPIGQTCSPVCKLTTAQEIYYLNKSDHSTGYKQDTTFEGQVYCQAGTIMFQNDRNGGFSPLAAGTYAQGQVGTLCGFTIDSACSVSSQNFPQ